MNRVGLAFFALATLALSACRTAGPENQVRPPQGCVSLKKAPEPPKEKSESAEESDSLVFNIDAVDSSDTSIPSDTPFAFALSAKCNLETQELTAGAIFGEHKPGDTQTYDNACPQSALGGADLTLLCAIPKGNYAFRPYVQVQDSDDLLPTFFGLEQTLKSAPEKAKDCEIGGVPEAVTTVKGSKSNTSERVQSTPSPPVELAVNLNTSKSNNYRIADQPNVTVEVGTTLEFSGLTSTCAARKGVSAVNVKLVRYAIAPTSNASGAFADSDDGFQITASECFNPDPSSFNPKEIVIERQQSSWSASSEHRVKCTMKDVGSFYLVARTLVQDFEKGTRYDDWLTEIKVVDPTTSVKEAVPACREDPPAQAQPVPAQPACRAERSGPTPTPTAPTPTARPTPTVRPTTQPSAEPTPSPTRIPGAP